MNKLFFIATLGLFFNLEALATPKVQDANTLHFEFFNTSNCKKNPEFQTLCSVYPDLYRDWTSSEVISMKKALAQIKWGFMGPVLRALKAASKGPIYLVKLDDPQMEAASQNFNGQKVIFISTRLLSEDIQYTGSSEKTHTLTHELLHFYLSLKYGKDYYLSPFWVAARKATDWTSAHKSHYLSRTSEINKIFSQTRDMIVSGKKQQALELDTQTAQKIGFPSLYATTQIEEFVVEVLTYLIYNPSLSEQLSDSVYQFIKRTEFRFLLKPKANVQAIESQNRNLTENFEFVGRMLFQSQPLCTIFILNHGQALTAKHCFRQMVQGQKLLTLIGPNYVTLEFYSQDKAEPISITGTQIKSISEISGSNDWALILYEPSLTLGKIKIPKFDLTSKNFQQPGQKVFSVGYSLPQKARETSRLFSYGETTGRSGEISSLLPHYLGQLYESTLPGWYLASGSPIFEATGDLKALAPDQTLKLVGILSHTFDLTEKGEVDLSAIRTDFWGPWTKTNFSALPEDITSVKSGYKTDSIEFLYSKPQEKYFFPLSIFMVKGTGWTREQVMSQINRTREILKQCQIEPSPVRLEVIEPPFGHTQYTRPHDVEIVSTLPESLKPALFFMGADNTSEVYTSNIAEGSPMAPLMWTGWISQIIMTPAYQSSIPRSYNPVAHEVAHLLCDCGHTESRNPNLLSDEITLLNDHLTEEQCESFKKSSFMQIR